MGRTDSDALEMMQHEIVSATEEIEDYVLSGAPKDYTEYRHAIGRLQELARLEDALSEIRKKLLEE